MERMQISKTGTCNSGLTLLELIVVVFIITLIAGLVTPSFYFSDEGRLKKEAGKAASILRYLNDSSISRKETFHLKINLKNKILRWGIPDKESEEKLETLSEVFSTSTGKLSEGEVILFFSPSGLKEHLGINLKDKDKEMTVNFNPLSGRVKIKEDQGL